MIACLFSAFVRLHKGMNLYFIVLAESIEGATGSMLTLSSLLYAYASDVTTPEERTVVFGRIFAGMYAVIALG
jgi:hypothetical protein